MPEAGTVRIVFDPTFDGSSWPGPLHGRDAVAGEAWAGPRYFLDILETALGLGGLVQPQALRAAALVPAVRKTDGFWSRSAEVDPLAAARRLLEWRDALWMAGWRGEGIARRLTALATVTRDVLPGVPDRLAKLSDTLRKRSAGVDVVETLMPDDDLPATWRAIIGGLEAQGTRIIARVLDPAAAQGDLAAARIRAFRPAGDGSLQLVRSPGPLQAAEDVAAWLAEHGKLEETVIVGGDSVLDAALRRHGLPTSGSVGHPRDNALLQILPLTLALAWLPPDPQRALELLTLPASPIPKGIGWRLVEALHERPAVDSDEWRNAMDRGLAAIEDAEDRKRVRKRLHAIFTGSIPRGQRYPSAEIGRRLDLLDAWIRGRAEVEEDEQGPWSAAVRSCAVLRELVAQSGVDGLAAPQLERFVDEALDLDVPLEAFPAEVGVTAVQVPGAVAGPARQVVWWSFNLETVPGLAVLPLTRDEIGALAGAGIDVPEPGRLAMAAAQRWRRPLLQATEKLLLVCPRFGPDGEEQHPHPLWDELQARLTEGATLHPLVHARPAPTASQSARALRLLPTPRRAWSVGSGLVRMRDVESPSSLGNLLGCAFNWVVSYQGGVWGGSSAALPRAEQLLGDLTHAILARLLRAGLVSPESAAAEAQRLLDEEGPRLAAPLFLPGADAARASVRQSVGLAARELFRFLEHTGLRVQAIEEPVDCRALGGTLRGIPDLVVGAPTAIIDLKWSGAPYRRDELASGTAYQLAAYSFLHGGHAGKTFPPVAFFILRDQRLLSVDGSAFPGAERVAGAEPRATWQALERAYRERRAALAAGRLEAPGNPDDTGQVVPEASTSEGGTLVLAPPCNFCDLHLLCGKAFGSAG